MKPRFIVVKVRVLSSGGYDTWAVKDRVTRKVTPFIHNDMAYNVAADCNCNPNSFNSWATENKNQYRKAK